MTVKTAQLVTELDPGGAERVVYQLATRLDRSRFEPVVISLQPATGDVAGWLRDAGVPVRSVNMTSKLDLRARRRLTRLLREEGVKLLHAHLVHAIYLGRRAARAASVPAVISTVHAPERRFRPWHYWADSWTHSLVDVEVCVSEAVRRWTLGKTNLPESKLRVIHDGVDVGRFADMPRREDARRSLGLGDGDLVVLSLGRLRRQKGHDVAMRAFAEIAREEPRARLLVAGDGPERRALESLRAKLGLADRVAMLGTREDVPRLFSASDLVVAASRWEGFGLAVAEAMAAGVPVVATNVDSFPEILEDGVSGILVPPGDPPALARAALRVLRDEALARRLAGKARERVRRDFTVERMIRAHEEIYEGVLSAKGVIA
jgi:glycosyltransferase involved in cell wall biosynthesis